MTPEQFKRIEELYHEAARLPPGEVEPFLDSRCPDDDAVRSEVERMLEQSTLEATALHERVDEIVRGHGDDKSGERIGPYRLLGRIGEGGMGTVYLAEQEQPIRRRVALKVIKPGMDSRHVLARFESERQALALMSHPNVARVLDAGTTERGRPYFVMEHVRGVPITEHCDRHRLTTNERLKLFLRVCDGVRHAHQKAIIHRDLKPSNILVALRDEGPVPVIIDFGVAKAIDHRLTEHTLFTEVGQAVGTPEYMSPEQAERTGQDVDTRTDVYSLGVLLYELLVGALPFDSKELRAAGLGDLRRRLREQEPSRPSARFSTLAPGSSSQLARRRGTDPRELRRELRGDLDWITMKALEKDRTRRYGGVAELAEDVARYLRHEPVVAGPPSKAYRAAKFVRRHRIGVLVGGALVLSLVAGATVATIGLVRAVRAERSARLEAATSAEVIDLLQEMFAKFDPRSARGEAVDPRDILDPGVASIRESLAERPEVKGRLLHVLGLVYRGLGRYDEAQALLVEAVEDRRRVHGEHSPEVVDSLNAIAGLLIRQRRGVEARSYAERALASLESTARPDGLALARTLNNLGSAALLEGRREDALGLYQRCLAAREAALGPTDPELIGVLSNIGSLQRILGNEEEALESLERALAIADAGLPGNHPDRARVLNMLGTLHRRAGRYEQAREVLERARAIREHALGEEHPDSVRTLINLGETYLGLGDHERAAATLDRAARLGERIGPTATGLRARALERLVQALDELGRTEQAREHRRMLAALAGGRS